MASTAKTLLSCLWHFLKDSDSFGDCQRLHYHFLVFCPSVSAMYTTMYSTQHVLVIKRLWTVKRSRIYSWFVCLHQHWMGTQRIKTNRLATHTHTHHQKKQKKQAVSNWTVWLWCSNSYVVETSVLRYTQTHDVSKTRSPSLLEEISTDSHAAKGISARIQRFCFDSPPLYTHNQATRGYSLSLSFLLSYNMGH